jgi:4-amino-4-deoxy-L-arabinose transferase-like glycosyltransferase
MMSNHNKLAWIFIFASITLYFIGFVVYYPNCLTISDELNYVNQSTTISEAIHNRKLNYLPYPDTYPIGTALLQVPFVILWGWRASTIASMVSFLLCIIILAKWLQEENYSPIYSIIIFSFPAALVIGRSAMSDCHSALIVTLGLYLFWHGKNRHWIYFLTSGLLGGISLLIKEPNLVIFIPFYLGAFLRKEKNISAIAIGLSLGIIIRLVLSDYFFGTPFYIRPSDHHFSLTYIPYNIPYYLFILTAIIPGGLIALLLYKGKYRIELISSILLYLLIFLSFQYTASESYLFKRIILSGRYMIPLLPLFALIMAEVIHINLVKNHFNCKFRNNYFSKKLLNTCFIILSTLLLIMYFSVHYLFLKVNETRAQILKEICSNITANNLIITNLIATPYLANYYWGHKAILVNYVNFDIDEIHKLTEKYSVKIIFLWQPQYINNIEHCKKFLNKLTYGVKLELLSNTKYLSGEKLLIWKLIK